MKILKVKSILFSLLAITILYITSCEESAFQDIEDTSEITELNMQNVAKQRSVLAKHLSIKIAEQPEINEVLEEMIEEEVEKGYYENEIFFNIKKDETSELLNGSTLKARLATSDNEDACNAIDYLSINDPGLAILMANPSDSEDFNTRVYVDNGIDDSDPDALLAYYENGAYGTQPISDVPTTISFIVRKSEAYASPEDLESAGESDVKTLGTVNGQKIQAFGYKTLNQSEELENAPTAQNESSTLESRTQNCPRNDFSGQEMLEAFYTTKYYDYWNNAMEFRFDVIFSDNGGALSSTRMDFWGTNLNVWHVVQRVLFTWDENDHDYMKYRIVERDSGYTITVNVGIPDIGSVEISYKNGDDFVAEQIVEYCGGIVNTYSGEGVYYPGNYFRFSVAQTGSPIGPGPDQQFHNVTFKSTDNRYMVNEGDGSNYVYANRYAVGAWEKFSIFMKPDGTFAMKGSNNKYADVDWGGGKKIKFSSTDMYCSDCRFKFVNVGGGYKAIQSVATGQFVSSEGTYNVPCHANRSQVAHWEKWIVSGM